MAHNKYQKKQLSYLQGLFVCFFKKKIFNASNKLAQWLYNFHSFYLKCNVVVIHFPFFKKKC